MARVYPNWGHVDRPANLTHACIWDMSDMVEVIIASIVWVYLYLVNLDLR
jgi:hypothetical protein